MPPAMSEQPSESARQAIVPDTAAGRRFDAVVAELFPEYSRSRLTEWIKAGEVLLDGARCARAIRCAVARW